MSDNILCRDDSLEEEFVKINPVNITTPHVNHSSLTPPPVTQISVTTPQISVTTPQISVATPPHHTSRDTSPSSAVHKSYDMCASDDLTSSQMTSKSSQVSHNSKSSVTWDLLSSSRALDKPASGLIERAHGGVEETDGGLIEVEHAVRRALERGEEGIRVGQGYPGCGAQSYQFNRLQSYPSSPSETLDSIPGSADIEELTEDGGTVSGGVRQGLGGQIDDGRGKENKDKTTTTEPVKQQAPVSKETTNNSTEEPKTLNFDSSFRFRSSGMFPNTNNSALSQQRDIGEFVSATSRRFVAAAKATKKVSSIPEPDRPRRRSEEIKKKYSCEEISKFLFSARRREAQLSSLRVEGSGGVRTFIRSFVVGMAGGSIVAIAIRMISQLVNMSGYWD